MAPYFRPGLGAALVGLPTRVVLEPGPGGRWRSAAFRAVPRITRAAPDEVIEVTVLLPADGVLVFAPASTAAVRSLFAPPTPGGAFTGPALLPLRFESEGPPRFSHVAIVVRARYVGHSDVYLRQRIVTLR